jgi:hypothetical protein
MAVENKDNLKCASCNYCPHDLNELFYQSLGDLGISKKEDYILCEICLNTYD